MGSLIGLISYAMLACSHSQLLVAKLHATQLMWTIMKETGSLWVIFVLREWME